LPWSCRANSSNAAGGLLSTAASSLSAHNDMSLYSAHCIMQDICVVGDKRCLLPVFLLLAASKAAGGQMRHLTTARRDNIHPSCMIPQQRACAGLMKARRPGVSAVLLDEYAAGAKVSSSTPTQPSAPESVLSHAACKTSPTEGCDPAPANVWTMCALDPSL
jgi:hypothetical protein